MTSSERTLTTRSADETRAAGAELAQRLQPGDVVLLTGDLGAGKTQFSQGVAAGLGVREVPISPTFNIVLTYGSGKLPLHHFDLYRLDSEDQLEDIGIAEYLESGGVCLVEWAEKFPGAFDASYTVSIEKTSDDERFICIRDTREEGGRTLAHSQSQERGVLEVASDADGEGRYVLAFDTANEVVALGVGLLVPDSLQVKTVATREIAAHRASNTTLVPAVDDLLGRVGITRDAIACVCVGRGPGSFTGVRICMAAAKGIAQALGVGLVGVSTLDAVAWGAQTRGLRGDVLVLADAMRKEVYPAHFRLLDEGMERLSADCVVKAGELADCLVREFGSGCESSDSGCESSDSGCESSAGGLGDTSVAQTVLASLRNSLCEASPRPPKAFNFVEGAFGEGASCGGARGDDGLTESLTLIGDGLVKYRELFSGVGAVGSDKLWEVTGVGLLLALQQAWRAGDADPFDAKRHDPAFALPVYTRLSDAEENERIRLAADEAAFSAGEKNLRTGVQALAPDGGKGRATMHSQAQLVAPEGTDGVAYHPLDARHVAAVASLEGVAMGSDAWNERLVASELGQRNRTWWIAEHDGRLVGYAGGLVVDGDLQILKIAVDPVWRRHGVARQLIVRVAEDARNLGASSCSLEVRAGNVGAQAFYESLGLKALGTRPRYYSDREDAVIMEGPLPAATHDVAGMELLHHESREMAAEHPAPLILAIESSCDETAAAVVDGGGALASDVVASQIDFHARFGGVVPEIASRKHIEAICGVCAEALETAGIGWGDLDSVAVTYAPGLLGALVVGVAYAKGAAWALDVPFIGVNHLEGHLYANKIDAPDFSPPAVVSLVSGGNTMLVHMRSWGDYAVLGETIDDAVGEAFDKVAKALGLGYPGGPVISKQAASGDASAIAFPRAMLHSHDLRFSLSGLKTAVVNYINTERNAGRELNIPNIAASFQQAVIDVQVAKARDALRQTGAPTFCLGGGVAANPELRHAYENLCAEEGVRLVMPPLSSCGDNAGMIALVALDRFRASKFFPLNADAQAHADLSQPY